MNAKKLFLLGAASTMLLASCGKSLTRAEAIEAMDAISKGSVSSTKLTYVVDYKEANTGTGMLGKGTLIYDSEQKFASMVTDMTYTDKNGKTEDNKGSIVIYNKDSVYTVAINLADTKEYFAVSASDDSVTYAAIDKSLGAVPSTAIKAEIAAGLAHASKSNGYGYCGFLAKFPEGEGTVAAGGSIKEGAYITGESYKQSNDNSIACEYNAVYPNQGDEVMKAEWKDGFLVAKSNAKLTSSGYGFETWDYKSAKVAAPKLDGLTQVTDKAKIAVYIPMVAATFLGSAA